MLKTKPQSIAYTYYKLFSDILMLSIIKTLLSVEQINNTYLSLIFNISHKKNKIANNLS